MIRALLLWFAAYLLGSIPVGVIVAEYFSGNDPRNCGSGNVGATNVSRAAGPQAGLVTLLGDAAKGLVAVLLARIFGAGDGVAALAGLIAFLGHLYPIFLNYKGGKGVATGLGVFFALCPGATIAGVIVFAAVTAYSHFVSLGSLTAALCLPAFAGLSGYSWKIVFVALICAALIVYRHRENILRLLNGEENKLF